MDLINLTSHRIDFVDGSKLYPYDKKHPVSVYWDDEVVDVVDGDSKEEKVLIKRIPKLPEKEYKRLKRIIGDEYFGIVSFPVVSAVRDTDLEGRVGCLILKSRHIKKAIKNKFCV